jgi:phage terminase small subunit
MVKLSVKHQAFADYYIEFGSAEQAAIKAGYSKTYARGNAHKLVAHVSIKAYIDGRLESLKDKRIADQEEILRLLTDIARGQTSGTALVGIGGGAQSVEQIPPTLSERTKAAELLGKRYAMWTDKKDINLSGSVGVNLIDDVPKDDDE